MKLKDKSYSVQILLDKCYKDIDLISIHSSRDRLSKTQRGGTAQILWQACWHFQRFTQCCLIFTPKPSALTNFASSNNLRELHEVNSQKYFNCFYTSFNHTCFSSNLLHHQVNTDTIILEYNCVLPTVNNMNTSCYSKTSEIPNLSLCRKVYWNGRHEERFTLFQVVCCTLFEVLYFTFFEVLCFTLFQVVFHFFPSTLFHTFK